MKAFFSNSCTLALLILYTSISIYAVLEENCLVDREANLRSILIGLPCAFASMALYFRYGSTVRYRWFINILAIIILFPVFKTWGPLLLRSTVQGHHLCGKEFDGHYMMQVSERLLPFIHLGTASIILVILLSVSINRMKRSYVVGPFYID